MICFLSFIFIVFLFITVLYLADCDVLLFLYSKWPGVRNSLAGKTIWITGASSGIGEELAYHLSRLGAKLILSARREKELQKVLEKCQELSPTKSSSHMMLPLDLMQYNQHESCVKTVIQRYGQVDYLVNNAGKSQTGMAIDTSIEVSKYLLEVNTLGTINLTRTLLPYMGKGSSIVIISSIAGKLGSPCSSSYSASKHALQGYFDALRVELYSSGISVLSVCPGPIETGPRRTIGITLNKDDEVPPLKTVDHRMTVERCCQLTTVAMATKLDEVWISKHPVLLFTYVNQYAPLLAKMLGKTIGQKRIERIKSDLKKN